MNVVFPRQFGRAEVVLLRLPVNTTFDKLDDMYREVCGNAGTPLPFGCADGEIGRGRVFSVWYRCTCRRWHMPALDADIGSMAALCCARVVGGGYFEVHLLEQRLSVRIGMQV
jgi:hypothetical protein